MNHPLSDRREKSEIRLTVPELIKAEITSKKDALRRYDDIIWRIRSGYVVILYGALGRKRLVNPIWRMAPGFGKS
jgi:hypothetical protein